MQCREKRNQELTFLVRLQRQTPDMQYEVTIE